MTVTHTNLPWYRRWFDKNYLLLYSHRDDHDAKKQIRLITQTLKIRREDPILDLGCGMGRHAHLLHEDGYTVFGLDLSRVLLEEAGRRYGLTNLILGDVRRIPGLFAVILSLFTSFGYFETDSGNQQVLNEVSRSLKPGGWFWLDYLSPGFVKSSLANPLRQHQIANCQIEETRRIIGNRVVKDIHFRCEKGYQHYRESVCLYKRRDLEDMFISAGLRPMGVFGDYSGGLWTANSPRTIIYGSK